MRTAGIGASKEWAMRSMVMRSMVMRSMVLCRMAMAWGTSPGTPARAV